MHEEPSLKRKKEPTPEKEIIGSKKIKTGEIIDQNNSKLAELKITACSEKLHWQNINR